MKEILSNNFTINLMAQINKIKSPQWRDSCLAVDVMLHHLVKQSKYSKCTNHYFRPVAHQISRLLLMQLGSQQNYLTMVKISQKLCIWKCKKVWYYEFTCIDQLIKRQCEITDIQRKMYWNYLYPELIVIYFSNLKIHSYSLNKK